MIEIVPYNINWPVEFETIADALRRALGEVALRVDHIGSTSVPGLAAKNIIDIQVTVLNFEEHNRMVTALAGVGFSLREGVVSDHLPPGWTGADSEWEKRLFGNDANQRPANLHIRAHGRANQRYALLFRDYLRVHPSAAAAYAEFKRRLASYLAEARRPYTEIKDPVCDLIMVAAEDWARATDWLVR